MAEPQPSKASKQALPPFQHSIATDQELEQKLAEPGIKGAHDRFVMQGVLKILNSREIYCLLSSIQWLMGCVTVVELHSWAGPCKAVVNAFKRLHFEHEDEAVLQFLSVSAVPA